MRISAILTTDMKKKGEPEENLLLTKIGSDRVNSIWNICQKDPLE